MENLQVNRGRRWVFSPKSLRFTNSLSFCWFWDSDFEVLVSHSVFCQTFWGFFCQFWVIQWSSWNCLRFYRFHRLWVKEVGLTWSFMCPPQSTDSELGSGPNVPDGPLQTRWHRLRASTYMETQNPKHTCTYRLDPTTSEQVCCAS